MDLKNVASLTFFLPEMILTFTILFVIVHDIDWLVAVLGAARIAGIGWTLLATPVHDTSAADETVVSQLGLSDPRAVAMAAGIDGVQNLQQAMGTMIAIAGTGDMRLKDLNETLSGGILSVAKGYGATLQDVAAVLATMGDNGIRGADAATQLRMALMGFAQPAKEGEAALNSIGLTMTSLRDEMQQHGALRPKGGDDGDLAENVVGDQRLQHLAGLHAREARIERVRLGLGPARRGVDAVDPARGVSHAPNRGEAPRRAARGRRPAGSGAGSARSRP